MSTNKKRMLGLKCPNCGKGFYRSREFARTVTRCPACHMLCTFNKEGKCALIKQVKYANPLLSLLRRRQLKPIGKIAKEIQGAVGWIRKPSRVVPISKRLSKLEETWGATGRGKIRLPTPKELQQQLKQNVKWVKGEKLLLNPMTGRQLLAHEITHVPIPESRTWTSKRGMVEVDTTPVFKSLRRNVEKVMQRTGAMKKLKKLGYAREDPKHVRSYFNELKQHKVSFRTRMQWLSRIYGGKGGYTSEELYKIVTGKITDAYYIFPFVKGAPPEVNRILERTYRKHREAGDGKVAAAIAAWNKVKQAGFTRDTRPSPVWVKRKKYQWLQPMRLIR